LELVADSLQIILLAGILQGGKVKFDLTNGTLLIGDSVERLSGYVWAMAPRYI